MYTKQTIMFIHYIKTSMKRKLHLLTTGLIFLFISCQNNSSLDEILLYSDKNYIELEKVLKHYKTDSIKSSITYFLLENMFHHYTIDSNNLSTYYKVIDSINHLNFPIDIYRKKYDSINAYYNNINEKLEIKSDLQNISADYLIENIDMAYDSWKEGLWATHLTFEEFCELLLPYRYGNENITEWRKVLQNKYQHRIMWLDDSDDKRNYSYWAALYMNDQLKRKGFRVEERLRSPVDFPPLVLDEMKMGSCVQYAQSAAAIMRACGIPVAIDFTPQWPFRSLNHTWNVVLDNNGLYVPFMGGESNPGYPNKPAAPMAKVYRYTYGFQQSSLFAQKGKEEVPPLFNTPFFKDVSASYFRAIDVKLKLDRKANPGQKFAYLAVFDNQEWKPVQWAKIDWRNRAVFKEMGHNIVYLPVYYKDGRNIAAGAPFLLSSTDEVISLEVDRSKQQQMVVRRKFPVFSGVLGYSGRMVNGIIEASDRADFKNSVEMARITRYPLMRYDTVHCSNNEQKYRYWRYVSPENGHCNVADLQFISDEGQRLSGTILTPKEFPCSNGHDAEKAFDDDGLTFYETQAPSGGWVGMDFGESINITTVRYLPRNDDNNIWPGNVYQLQVWDKEGWQVLETQEAVTDSLIFDNVPIHGLFRLHNTTRGTEERIFTYENGKQVWW